MQGRASQFDALLVLRTKSDIATHLQRDAAIGTMHLVIGGVADLPAGWVACDGQAIPRKDYPELAAALGNQHARGAEPDVLMLPDLRGVSALDLLPEAAPWVIRLLSDGRIFRPVLLLGDNNALKSQLDNGKMQITGATWVVKAR
ncbi:MAG: phage tail protein [Planctomycetota bacterium]